MLQPNWVVGSHGGTAARGTAGGATVHMRDGNA